MFGNIYIPGYTRRALREGVRAIQEWIEAGEQDPAYGECIDAALPQMTLVTPAQSATLEAWYALCSATMYP